MSPDPEYGGVSYRGPLLARRARRYGISRTTGHKWLERYRAVGPDGLLDRSQRPHTSPQATPDDVLEAAVELRGKRPRGEPL